MGVPDGSLVDLFGKIRSWISWGRSGFSSRSLEFAMAENVCKICSECELQFTDFCSKFNCRGCGRWLCGSCVRRSGSLIILATAGGLENCCHLEKIIKSCKFCLKASNKRYTEKIYPSESPRESPERPSTCFVGDKVCDSRIDVKIHDDAHCKAEQGEHSFSSSAIDNDNSFTSPSVHTSPVSVRCSLVRSDEETEYYEKQFSPSSENEYDHDSSDVETNSISFSHSNYSCRSVGSSPSDSPSRINVSQPGVGHSVHHEKVGDPNSRNAGPFNREMAVLVKPEGGTGNVEYTLSCADDTPILGKGNTFKKQLDFEKDDQIWFPPPPEDESGDYERNYFEYDDDDDEIGDSGGMFLSSAGVDSLFHNREKHCAEQNEPIKSVIHDHFRALVSQLLQGEGINLTKEDETEDWLAIISNLAWQAAKFVKPDTKKGGSMDPGAYVKIKCVASGRPSESSLIKGVVCTKNIKHKRMTSQYKHPRLLLLGGSLEYRSTASELDSFNTLLEEEKNHLKIFLSRIEAHRPNVLLVEKSVSPYVQEYLLTKEISLVLNVKRHLLERIARCSGASIAPVDNISLARLGHCELFRLEKVSEELGSASQFNKRPSKTLMFFEGCPRRLGCTILLNGSSTDELKKVKHVVQYAVFAAYHLSLETSFLADEGASLLKATSHPSSTVTEHAKDIFIKTAPDSAISGLPQPSISVPVLTEECPGNSIEVGDLVSSAESLHYASLLAPVNDRADNTSEECIDAQLSLTAADSGSITYQSHILGLPGCPGGVVNSLQTESLEATALAEQLSIEPVRNAELVSNQYLSAAGDHQSILVSHSSCCVTKGVLCERSRLLRIKYYGSFDKPLGRYLRDDLFDPVSYCRSCKGSIVAHVQCYTHQQGSLTINVRRLSSHKLPGQQDGKIWMWHRCLQCAHKDGVPPLTHRVVMSDAAWGLSFGKFLELSFSNHATANRIARCGHSLQRDCLRFYGCGNMVACFHYIPIDILSVRLPPSMLEFDSDMKQDWLRTEAAELKRRIETLYMEITDVLDGIEQRCACLHNGTSDYRHLNKQIVALKDLLGKERYDYYLLLHQDNEDTSPVVQKGVDVMKLNNLRHSLLITSHVWDYRFYSLDSFLGSLSSAHEASKAALLHDELSISLPCMGVKSGSERAENDSDLSQVEESTSKMNANLETSSSENHNGSSSLLVRSEEVNLDEQVTVGDESLEGIPSSAADLSAKIDSAWTGMVEDKSHLSHVLLDGSHGGASQVNPIDNLPLKRLKAPARVYSFDSITRSREKLHKASISSSLHLSAARSFHCSGGSENMDGVLWTHSQISPQEAQRFSSILSSPPAYISCASHLAEGARLLLPHVGRNNLVIAVYDDEPTSIVSYALSSKEHEDWVCDKLNDFEGGSSVCDINVEDHTASSISSWPSFGSVDLDYIGYGGYRSEDVSSRISSLFQSSNKSPHMRVAFEDDSISAVGKAKFSVTCYFAKQFDMLRRKCCPDEASFVCSLSRCKKWGAQGGKSNVYFAKSMDDRFIIKQVTKTELESFGKFATQYFKYMTESLNSGGPTCLAKVLGIYQVSVKNLKGGKETKMDLMVMENLFFKRNISRIYDLKGSSRSRYNPDKTGANNVLLDTNLLEALSTNPIFLGSKAKRSLERAVWNDTSFLASVDVMDYSLLVGVDEESKELVLGIIDFMRQYTWDKHLETWVKASGILGGPKNALPTIISPKQYKRRFRKAMTTYFLTVPDQWSSSNTTGP